MLNRLLILNVRKSCTLCSSDILKQAISINAFLSSKTKQLQPFLILFLFLLKEEVKETQLSDSALQRPEPGETGDSVS